MCALVATRTDSELQEVLGGEALASFDLSFFSSATAPQLVGGLLAKVGALLALSGLLLLLGLGRRVGSLIALPGLGEGGLLAKMGAS